MLDAAPSHQQHALPLKFFISLSILFILSTSIYILEIKARHREYIERSYGISAPDVLGIYVPKSPLKNMLSYIANVFEHVVEEYRFAFSPEKIRDVNDIFAVKEGKKLVPKLPIENIE